MLQNPRINHAVVLKTCSESYDSKFQNLTFSRSTGSKRGRGGGGGPLPGGGRGLPALFGPSPAPAISLSPGRLCVLTYKAEAGPLGSLPFWA